LTASCFNHGEGEVNVTGLRGFDRVIELAVFPTDL
jgi:hypothetical protein